MQEKHLKSLKKKPIEIELDLLPTGEILIKRNISQEKNEAVLQMLKQIGLDTSDIEEFIKSSDLIKYIVGDEALCG